MSLHQRALLEFDLPAAPQWIDELPAAAPGAEAFRVRATAGTFLVLCCTRGPLAMAFEATLFDLLAESRFPAPRPRRARGGLFIAKLNGGSGAAACYAWPAGEPLTPQAATDSQLIDLGRLLARLHQLAETHPASVPDPADGPSLAKAVPAGPEQALLAPVLEAGLSGLPLGALHGGLRPGQALFAGDRCSAVLPSGLACSGPLVLDLAESALGWMLDAENPLAALHAVTSGYQSQRRLAPEEVEALFPALRYAAAREGARRAAMGRPEPLVPLQMVDGAGESAIHTAITG